MKIKKIVITSKYSISGKSFSIDIGKEGNSITIDALSNILALSNYEKIKNIKEYFESVFDCLNINSSLNYSLILGDKKSKEYLEYIKQNIDFAKTLVSDYHHKYFLERLNCYSDFHLVSLEDKILEAPVYNHISTTGRTSIKSGYNFLTMKKEERKKLKPVIENDTLLEMDFKSCEPFFYLVSQNILDEKVDDIYSWLASKINLKDYDRDKFKRGVLSIIYGASNETVKSISQIDKSNIEKIKSIMEIDEFKKRLEKEYEKNGFIRNYYGRPIKSNANIVNYWIQSSAADYCSLAFNKFKLENNVRFCFLIHDSVTFLADKIEKNKYLEIKSLNYEGLQIPVKTSLY